MGSPVAPLACAVIALAPGLGGCEILGEESRSGKELPREDQRRLPIRASLGNLCPGASSPRRFERRLRRQAERLLVELDRRPDRLVRYTYYWSDAEPERKLITVRELAEEQLHDLDVGGGEGFPECAPALQRRLRAALG